MPNEREDMGKKKGKSKAQDEASTYVLWVTWLLGACVGSRVHVALVSSFVDIGKGLETLCRFQLSRRR